jgi:hypothetical protein
MYDIRFIYLPLLIRFANSKTFGVWDIVLDKVQFLYNFCGLFFL